jgi:prepilin-type N-terminal cleavage/methylation domain-containing protein
MKKIKAFTLIELIMVMAIIATLAIMGVYGLTRFRGFLELQTSYNDIVSIIKTIQNSARNSIQLNDGTTPEYYTISFTDNKYSLLSCNNANCISVSSSTDIQIGSSPRVVVVNENCSNIAFGRLTGNIVSINISGSSIIDSSISCRFTIRNLDTLDERILLVDLAKNIIIDG